MNIQITDAQGLYYKVLIDTYIEQTKVTKFLASFFRVTETTALELSIEVERNFEKIAVDVLRGSDGNRNTYSRSTEKIWIPPYFKEYFDITNLDMYKRLLAIGADYITDQQFAELINQGVKKMQGLVDKIERGYERFRAQVLTTGIMELNADEWIDFKRRAESLVDLGAGNYFANAIDPFKPFADGAGFLRTKGKSYDANFQAIMGQSAANDLFGNAIYIARKNQFNYPLDKVEAPARNSEGAAYHGRITAESYTVDLWTYPQSFDDDTNEAVSFLDDKKVVMIPSNPKFDQAFAGVPQLIESGQPPKKGAYIFTDFVDQKKKTHEFYVESAGMPIPVAVDQIYTFKAKA